MQNLIVILIVIGALYYVGRSLFNSMRSDSTSCGCGCSGCSNTGCVSAPDNKLKENKK